LSDDALARTRELVDSIYETESRRVLATLIRLLGDFDLAEEALQDAFTAALAQWPRSGVPANPRAWLVSAGRFKAIGWAKRFRDIVGDGTSEIVQVYGPDDNG
jgi:RNA polymerase sigma-70 factor, ECF subfamily